MLKVSMLFHLYSLASNKLKGRLKKRQEDTLEIYLYKRNVHKIIHSEGCY